jgi:large subunit ribosomal protein L24
MRRRRKTAVTRIRIRKEDQVIVISGKDRDRSKPRRVLQVLRDQGRILVEGVHVVKRHTRPNPQRNIKGGIVEREAPIHVSNVLLVDPETKRPTRVGSKTLADGRRVRVARTSGAQIDK